MPANEKPTGGSSANSMPDNAKPSLNWGGRLVLGLIFASGVALLVFLGLVIGMFVGLSLARR